jgi:hypothetical protein
VWVPGVAGAVAEAGGGVDGPGESEPADGELRQLAMAGGRVAGPQRGGVLGEGGVADIADIGEGFDLPGPLDQFGELGGRGGWAVRLVTAYKTANNILKKANRKEISSPEH